jgi:wyosine [tRNA(Phe)-imidazoG37] synthetase (radical SAM superfamily)
MFDVDFYMRSHGFMKEAGEGKIKDKKEAFNILEGMRSKEPYVYNIETTNACNMRCEMCPRTTRMTRPVETMAPELFGKIADQIRPQKKETWGKWEEFVRDEYGIRANDMSENHLFLLIIPKVLQLHGYGDPLLDRNMAGYIKLLTGKGIPSYFSCNPANIDIDRIALMFENGLSYIKYSIESVDDKVHKQIRGKASNFTDSYKKILKLLELKKEKGYGTVVIITMLDLNRQGQKEEYAKLKELFRGQKVYIYLKSEDQQWYREDFHGTGSVHWSEFCKHAWMSMTIKSNSEAAMCMEDYNNEIILGDAKRQTLYEIWNGERYRQFRLDHIYPKNGIKCVEECDMKLIGEYLN